MLVGKFVEMGLHFLPWAKRGGGCTDRSVEDRLTPEVYVWLIVGVPTHILMRVSRYPSQGAFE